MWHSHNNSNKVPKADRTRPNWRITLSAGSYGCFKGKLRHRRRDPAERERHHAVTNVCGPRLRSRPVSLHLVGVPRSHIGAKRRRRTPNIYDRDQVVLIESILFRPSSSRFVKSPSKCWIALGEVSSVLPMMDWSRVRFFQLIRRRRVRHMCTARSKKRSRDLERERR
jgi:hypothetical protein